MSEWLNFLAGQVLLADPDERVHGITGLERLQAVRELCMYADQEGYGSEMAKASAGKGSSGGKGGKAGHGKPGSTDKGKTNIDKTGKPGKHHGGFLSGGKGRRGGNDDLDLGFFGGAWK